MRLVLTGRQGKMVIVEDNIVKIIKEGGMFTAQREKTFPLRNISSVEVKKPGLLVAGFIQFSIGEKSRDGLFTLTGGVLDATRNENSVVFAGQNNYEIALKIKSYVGNGGQSDIRPTAQSYSPADEISKLKKLMDDGVLTKDEFELKKKQLLGI